MSVKLRKPLWFYLAAVAALVASLWIGWGDFDPHVPRQVVQETIRASPQKIVQLLMQFVVPVFIIGFLAKEGLAFVRARRKV